MATWILETDRAIYLMEDKYYIDKIDKVPAFNGGYDVTLSGVKNWFASDNPPDKMKILRGSPEPAQKPDLAVS
jgi:hypothetical protein